MQYSFSIFTLAFSLLYISDFFFVFSKLLEIDLSSRKIFLGEYSTHIIHGPLMDSNFLEKWSYRRLFLVENVQKTNILTA